MIFCLGGLPKSPGFNNSVAKTRPANVKATENKVKNGITWNYIPPTQNAILLLHFLARKSRTKQLLFVTGILGGGSRSTVLPFARHSSILERLEPVRSQRFKKKLLLFLEFLQNSNAFNLYWNVWITSPISLFHSNAHSTNGQPGKKLLGITYFR